MAQVTVTLRAPKWRLAAAQLAIKVLIFTEMLFPGIVDEEAATKKIAEFIVRGMRVVG